MITAARRLKSMMTSAGVMSSQVVVIYDCGASSKASLLSRHSLLSRRVLKGVNANTIQAMTTSGPYST